MMPRICSFILVYLLFMATAVNAELVSDNAKYINLYKKHFNQRIAADLYASPAENQSARALRQQILDYLNKIDYKVTPEVSEKNWKEYIQREFPTEEAFKLKLKNSYLEEKLVKNKFIQNQYFDYYFQTVIQKRIEADIANRYKVLEFAKTKNIQVTDVQLEEKLLQMIQNWGGDAHFESFMKASNLSSEDIVFFIRTDLTREAIMNQIISSDLEKSSEFSSYVNSAIYNQFQNFNLTQSPDYYFTQVSIQKEIPDAKVKIEKAHKLYSNAKNIISNSNEDADLTVTKMLAPVNVYSDLYLAPIKENVLKLTNDGLLVNKALSPVFETASAYSFVQINDVYVPENLTYDQAKVLIYHKIRTQKSRDFNSLFSELLK